MDPAKESVAVLTDALASAPEVLLQPTDALRESARSSVKYFLDPVARQYSKVFKNGIYVDGLDALQIWEQTRLVLDGVAENVLYDRYVEITGEGSNGDDDSEDGDDELEKIAKRRKLTAADEDEGEDEDESGSEGRELSGSEAEVSDMSEDDDELAFDDENEQSEGNSDDASEDEDDLVEQASEDEEAADADSDGDIDMDNLVDDYEDSDAGSAGSESDEGEEKFVKDKFGLNDGFFDIDQFNRMTEDAESSALNNDEDDDDEEIDFFADPDEQTTISSKPKSSKKQESDDEEDNDSEDYDEDDIEGHFGPIGQSAGGAVEDNSNDIRFEDFFKPPSNRRQGKPRSERPRRKEKFQGLGSELDDEDLEQAMDGLKKDLFADDEEDEEDDGASAEDGKKLSTYEKMQQKLRSQISKLEEENVAKKDWTLMGEAKASARPLNSLLEEDLEFDRGAKPVPVITSEVTESLEDLIRNRIKNNDFNDVPRRLPDSMPEFRKSRYLDVDQTKSSKSLAELYEDDHMRQADPEGHPTVEDSKLQKMHREVEEMFADITFKLDALSSWHFTPKPAKPAISIVANVPAIAMEDAQPSVMSTENMLAPQEVYVPRDGIKKDKTAGDEPSAEVLGPDGLPVARSEMSREEKKRRRRREKERYAKRESSKLETRAIKAQKEGSRANVVETLKKGNVTVIGKRGEKLDVDGHLKKDRQGPTQGTGLKL
ncbi:Mpp10 protein-domain-containing protein [Myxozyma melibiosi]|uniref:Mpp10 protein-domain-containing protein n=1 Tax=Myxozyma melibiosi TaxID=54550 RepID=A0ABR1FDM8_9ASCO